VTARSLRGGRAAAVGFGLGALYLIWGSTYLAVMVAIRTMPPLLMSSVRFLVAGALLYAWARRREPGASTAPDGRQWLAAGTTGFALLLVGSGGIAWDEQRLDSGVAALLGASIPLWIALLDRAVFGSRLSRSAMLGMGIGLAGVFVLVGPASGGVNLVGAGAVLISSLAWAAGSLHARSSPLPRAPLLTAAMQMLVGGMLLGIAGISAGEVGRVHLEAFSIWSLAAFAYLVLAGSMLAYPLYQWLLRSAPTRVVTTHAYVNPAVAVLLGWAVLAEPLTSSTLVAAGAIVASVVLIVGSRAVPARGRVIPFPGVRRTGDLAADVAA
jgi:drug/metabolite transporter (DMT)-like permease